MRRPFCVSAGGIQAFELDHLSGQGGKGGGDGGKQQTHGKFREQEGGRRGSGGEGNSAD